MMCKPLPNELCKHCGGRKSIRNPTGNCDHLYWPDNLTDEAQIANGYRREVHEVWTDRLDEDHGIDWWSDPEEGARG